MSRRITGEPLVRAALLGLRAMAHLPYAVVAGLGTIAGLLVWWLAWPRRRIALINLALCFPQWSSGRRRAVARAHFVCFTRSFFERFIFWNEPLERVRSLVRLEGMEHFDAVAGRPVILLAPHFVGIDAGGVRFSVEHPGVSVYARQKSAALNAAMTRGRLRNPASRMVLRTDGMRAVIRALRQGLPLYFLPDMDLGARDAIFVPFFGVPAATVPSVARLAQATGAVVIPFVTRLDRGGYVAKLYPAWENYPGDDLAAATRRMNEFIEERVLEMPEQYLWSHRRFKTRPPGAMAVYP